MTKITAFLQSIGYLLLLISCCTGCVSSANLFQDGHTAGKKKSDVAVTISDHLAPRYKTDSATRSVNLKPYHLAAPWLQLQYQYGLLERLDIGASFGLGLFTLGFEGFTKVALLPRTSKFGMAAMGLAGFATLNEDVSDDGESIDQTHLLVALPMSYEFNKNTTVILQPIVEWEYYRYHFPDDAGDFRGYTNGRVYKIGLGLKKTYRGHKHIHYNIAMNYVPEHYRLFPTFGVAFQSR